MLQSAVPVRAGMNDRLLRACRAEATDCTPVWFMRQAGRYQSEYRALRQRLSFLELCKTPDACTQVTLLPVDQLGVDAAILFADITLPLEGMGVPFDLVEGVGPVIERPVRTAADLQTLRRFEPERDVPYVLETVRLVRRAAHVPLIGFAGAPFTLASYLIEGRGSKELLRTKQLLFGAPDVWHDLMTRLTDTTLAYLAAQVQAGCQAVQVFDSWVGALSPADYEASVCPHMRRLFDGLRLLGVPAIHFGTGSTGLLRLMAQAGGDVIGVDWRVRLSDAWAQIGRRAIQGNLDPAVLLAPFEVVENAARRILTEVGGRPGHIFNLGHGVLPATPPDHLRRLVDLVHQATLTQMPGGPASE